MKTTQLSHRTHEIETLKRIIPYCREAIPAFLTSDPEEEPATPSSLDRSMLLRCLNHQSHLMHLYAEARKNILSFDVRMVLQRHQLQARETFEHLALLCAHSDAGPPGLARGLS